ncbi:uncharacterized protein V1516DRAFT_676139 [Lipomyces oligophaga]|uniref:uncharacterized protein n=1 Tax=Lipomyces oligophaga TaxID=45792 RepID=UPI0034CE1D15
MIGSIMRTGRRGLLVAGRAQTRREFTMSAVRAAPEASSKPARKPVGGFRGALLGFFMGTTLTGVAGYFYVLDVYRDANSLLLQDLVELQRHVTNVEKQMKISQEK